MAAIALRAEPLDAEAFAPYGDVLEVRGEPDVLINLGQCGRYHDRARLDFDARGRAGISLFHGQPYALPLTLTLLERHPLGSQAFLPLSEDPFLVVVAGDNHGRPVAPRAFLTAPGQGVNYLRNTWHAVLTPLTRAASFAVVDRIGPGTNLEEYHLDTPIVVT